MLIKSAIILNRLTRLPVLFSPLILYFEDKCVTEMVVFSDLGPLVYLE